MIIGAHSIIYSEKPDADRRFLRDVLKLPSVDVGGGWLIFGLPPAEVAVHPGGKNGVHALYFICRDVEALVRELQGRKVRCGPIQELGWGRLIEVTLPGGGELGIYEARHARPKPLAVKAAKAKKKPARRTRAR
jgi:hypothetical protein